MRLSNTPLFLAGLAGILLSTLNSANASIWADLDAKEVLGKNDGIDNVWVTKGGRTQRLRNPNAAMPLKGKAKSAAIETAKMTIEGEKYYLKIFENDVARERAWALLEKNLAEKQRHNNGNCPPGKRQYQKTAFLGLVKGQKLCLTDYEVEALRQGERHRALQNFSNSMKSLSESMQPPKVINCYSNTYGNYTSTSCY